MFAKRILIALLYVLHDTLAHCARNNSKSGDQFAQFIRSCCFHGINTTDNHRIRYKLETLNDTSANATAILRCTTCCQNAFEMGECDRQQEYVEAVPDASLSCFEACFSYDRIVSIWLEEKTSEKEDVFRNSDQHACENQTGQLSQCDSIFTSINFWGANIVIFANIVYNVPYLLVLVVYFSVPGLNTRAYNKAVICYNASQFASNSILIGIGFSILCHARISSVVFSYVGLAIMFLTISSTFWLFVICIDMTLVITRFRLAFAKDSNAEEERKKFLTYAAWTWGGSLLPTALASIAELSPLLPKSSPIRPNFNKFADGDVNLAVILYVSTVPLLTCLANTVLFLYTSYRMILIQKSTALATSSSTAIRVNRARKRYILFLKLYFLMDTPWISSALGAAFTDLWILKFVRMIQPIIMLLVILPRRMVTRVFTCACLYRKANHVLKI